MDSDGYRKSLTHEEELSLPASGSLRDDIRAVLERTTTGMCNTVMLGAELRVENGAVHIPPISGWAGVSIVMCHCIPEVEVNLPRIPGVERVVWDDSDDASAPQAPAPTEQKYSFKSTYPDAQAVTAAAWKQLHGALGALQSERCWNVPQGVGVPAAPGLLCWHVASAQLPEYVARLYRLEGKRLRRVWQGTVATWTNWLDLTPIVAGDGASLVVHDQQQAACEGAFREAQAKAESSIDTPWIGAMRRGCSQRGKWEYRRDKFVQVEKMSFPDPSPFW